MRAETPCPPVGYIDTRPLLRILLASSSREICKAHTTTTLAPHTLHTPFFIHYTLPSSYTCRHLAPARLPAVWQPAQAWPHHPQQVETKGPTGATQQGSGSAASSSSKSRTQWQWWWWEQQWRVGGGGSGCSSDGAGEWRRQWCRRRQPLCS